MRIITALLLSSVAAFAQDVGPVNSGGGGSAPCSAFGTTAGTCAQGNDSRITGAVQSGGALGTPSSGTLTNATGLPISTGVAGLGAGVATALAAAPNVTGGPVTAVTGCTAWTPTDQSGALLSFTAVSAQYCQYGSIVIAYGTLTYPSTADGSAAKISLPVAVPNQPYAAVASYVLTGAVNDVLKTVVNTSTAAFILGGTGAATANSTLSTKVINFIIMYPAS